MNPTLCPLCNQIHADILLAWIERRYKDLHRLQSLQLDHKEICQIINSRWYLDLWQSAKIGIDTVRVEYHEVTA